MRGSQQSQKRYFVYILSNYTRSTFYIGVTNNLSERLSEHRLGRGTSFPPKYNLKYLIYWEEFSDASQAIAREKQLKGWHRGWKLALIKSLNPEMRDLSEELPIQ
jgi:putative endonuclease